MNELNHVSSIWRRIVAILLLIFGCITSYMILETVYFHKFVGDYYTGLESRGCILSIKDDMTFSLTHVSWTPTRLDKGQVFNGTYEIEGGFMRMSLRDSSWSDVVCLVPKYTLVYWQDRKYLFAYDDGIYAERSQWAQNKFCENIRRGEELNRETSGAFLAFIDINDKEHINSEKHFDGVPLMFGLFPFCPK